MVAMRASLGLLAYLLVPCLPIQPKLPPLSPALLGSTKCSTLTVDHSSLAR